MDTKSIVPGSLSAIAQQNNVGIAETFISADVVILVDTSGSMADCDARGNRKRYDVACEELARLQGSMPGKIAVISFSSFQPVFCPTGVPVYLGNGTDLAGALRFAKVADGLGLRMIVISDGAPDSETEALEVAAAYTSRIDVVYVGPEGCKRERDFLARLAATSGGKVVTATLADQLAKTTQLLLNGAFA